MKILRKNIIGFIIGGIIFVSIGITMASQILATQVSYSNEDSPSGVENVSAALTELYGLAEECQNASSSGSTVEYKGKDAVAVYLDPTGSVTNCSSENFTSDTETKEGCMRFWVYAEDSEYKYAILDHNTTALGINFYAAQSQVKEDTKTWDPDLQARNIRADEVYKITESTNNKTNWQINGYDFYFNSTTSNGNNYSWLFDRTCSCTGRGCVTNDCGSNGMLNGYWTSDIYSSSQGWEIDYLGKLSRENISNNNSYGVRPVIKIPK